MKKSDRFYVYAMSAWAMLVDEMGLDRLVKLSECTDSDLKVVQMYHQGLKEQELQKLALWKRRELRAIGHDAVCGYSREQQTKNLKVEHGRRLEVIERNFQGFDLLGEVFTFFKRQYPEFPVKWQGWRETVLPVPPRNFHDGTFVSLCDPDGDPLAHWRNKELGSAIKGLMSRVVTGKAIKPGYNSLAVFANRIGLGVHQILEVALRHCLVTGTSYQSRDWGASIKAMVPCYPDKAPYLQYFLVLEHLKEEVVVIFLPEKLVTMFPHFREGHYAAVGVMKTLRVPIRKDLWETAPITVGTVTGIILDMHEVPVGKERVIETRVSVEGSEFPALIHTHRGQPWEGDKCPFCGETMMLTAYKGREMLVCKKHGYEEVVKELAKNGKLITTRTYSVKEYHKVVFYGKRQELVGNSYQKLLDAALPEEKEGVIVIRPIVNLRPWAGSEDATPVSEVMPRKNYSALEAEYLRLLKEDSEEIAPKLALLRDLLGDRTPEENHILVQYQVLQRDVLYGDRRVKDFDTRLPLADKPLSFFNEDEAPMAFAETYVLRVGGKIEVNEKGDELVNHVPIVYSFKGITNPIMKGSFEFWELGSVSSRQEIAKRRGGVRLLVVGYDWYELRTVARKLARDLRAAIVEPVKDYQGAALPVLGQKKSEEVVANYEPPTFDPDAAYLEAF